MIDAKEKTALTSSVGADDRQSILKYSDKIIPIESAEINSQDEDSYKKLRKLQKKMQTMNDPAHLHKVFGIMMSDKARCYTLPWKTITADCRIECHVCLA